MSSLRRTTTTLPRLLSRRAFTMSTRHTSSSPFKSGPAPPRLPKEEQEIFERLQKQSTGAFSTPRSDAPSSPTSSPSTTTPPQSSPAASTTQPLRPQVNQSPDSAPEIRFESGQKIRDGEDLHPNMRRGAPPEFEGDVNPKTGEVGGPKNEPLRWGVQGDWSYNGRVTDF